MEDPYQKQKLSILLQRLSVVKDKIQARRDNEEEFNVFSCMLSKYDEVHLHSRFISCILDPYGTHGLSDLPLRNFMSVVGSHFQYSLNTVQIYPSSSSWKEYKEIDILVIDRSLKHAIIIENKIYAQDSNHENEGQLERYYRRLIEEDKIPQDNIEVYYLTLDRHAPSKESVSTSSAYPELKDKVRCISYGYEIMEWCNRCMKDACTKPYIRETLAQYMTLIKDLTSNDTDDMEVREIIDVIGQNEDTLSSAALLAENFKHIKWFTIQDLFTDFSNGLKKLGYHVVYNDIESQPEILDAIVHTGHVKQWPAIHFEDENKLHYFIGCGWDCPGGFYYGLMKKGFNGSELSEEQSLRFNKAAHEGKNETWEHPDCAFLTYCVPSNESINIWNFSRKPTYMIINADYRKRAVAKHLQNMKDNLDRIISEVKTDN